MPETNVPKDLLEAALSVLDNAYAPYSRFRVASAIRDSSGRIFVGVNVENSSYGLTVCAERVAVFNMVTHGGRRVKEVLVLAGDSREPVPPCGACLQVLAEFAEPETIIYMVSAVTDEHRVARLRDLLPSAFRLDARRSKE
ncbi:MAG: cytidine deaminase [Desulfurococcales archaeon]|nr:cytidine deaminase [Desulfurococcales archaeon]